MCFLFRIYKGAYGVLRPFIENIIARLRHSKCDADLGAETLSEKDLL